MKATKTIILAAGQGTRMVSKNPKVLHRACGETLLGHVIRANQAAGVSDIAVIVGFQAEAVKKSLPGGVQTFLQAEQLGTGHAVMQASAFLEDFEGNVLVLVGDAPLIRPETLTEMIAAHEAGSYAATVLTAVFDDPTGYGRMVKEGDALIKIVEHKDATAEERAIREINSGMYCFDAACLREALAKIVPENVQGEYYLTDTIEILRTMGKKVGTYATPDVEDIAAVNSKGQLAQVEAIMRRRINARLMAEGVILIDPTSTYISADTTIGQDTVVYPGVITEGRVDIGADCIIGQNSRIVDSTIADGVEVQISTILNSTVDSGSHIGPYAYLRPNSRIGKDVKVGDFVEVKNAVMKDGAKASHLTYIGDAEVGRNVNLGCGTVFVNYDGVNKFKTVVEDNCFIGCNSNLISPVTVREGSYVAAGSTITQEVPEDSLAIARARQVNKVGYAEKMSQMHGKKEK
ncbi:MAG: bifunctional UDP-N-acetylglucosamine diphosphorylase/glucosamine-1-phosphate N-acetyltransferase GlmU [Eubacterium aggregans]|uniref:Bifunctional protein GlmU n=1 Tax=Eubacterium aggregans TaxID=81409 RepID=A0A1H4D7D3_9FIRM|nr:bifunctional UDP-N-acetylglucosamine diphosphorylase/glucosamine-1-phosphate N-acetyltransferase GlmU [Eubacterium aggregans]MDD4691016.1 bifunctional UDP-N-acetylglucosamine diphosphorylase/glucosamine-1-phosphate N-acetyltransferase GlmU [Eubacterium aggregans]MEA5072822.1 bifunctional UDP-N-acetylglucosamine diphosphorylase/glucosamine-1-phosphate N-acetyltransferase GlmU [Eubacterium aggregans]SEA68634.1 UDP-N-acetylglucosamine pyrophosphorylase /glucosamine-1-phosphate N-acetyltransferas